MFKKKHHGHHTGPIVHDDMHSHVGLDGLGKKDKHASKEYHASNEEHGMPYGLGHKHDRDGGGMGEEGGEGMAGNCSYH